MKAMKQALGKKVGDKAILKFMVAHEFDLEIAAGAVPKTPITYEKIADGSPVRVTYVSAQQVTRITSASSTTQSNSSIGATASASTFVIALTDLVRSIPGSFLHENTNRPKNTIKKVFL